MRTFNRKHAVVVVAAIILIGAGIVAAMSARGGSQLTDKDDLLAKAGAAAMAATGATEVIEAEAGEQGGFEVDVRLRDGRKLEVLLDANLKVVSQEADDDDDAEDDDGPDAH